MNFKVGDKVRVRKDLKQGDNFSRYVNDDMEKLAGEVVTIKIVGSTSYKLEEDNWSWTDDMLLKRAVKKAPVTKEQEEAEKAVDSPLLDKPEIESYGYKVGDKVTIKRGTTLDSMSHAGETLTIEEIKESPLAHRPNYFLAKEIGEGSGIYFDEIEGFGEIKESTHVEVKKQTQITVKDKELSLVYTTNTRKNRVSMHLNGQKQTRIRFQDIDRVIELLTRLKSEV